MSNPLPSPENDSLDALYQIVYNLNTLQEPDQLLKKALELAVEAMGADRGFILLNSSDTENNYTVKSSINFSASQLNEALNFSTTVVDEVMKEGKPILLHEALGDTPFKASQSIVIQQIQSIACVPLRRKQRHVGAIYMDSLNDRSRFRSGNLSFLEGFANLAAIGLENAHLYQTLRNENRQLRNELQSAHGFDEIIGSSPAINSLFDTMKRLLDNQATILIEGESGTGKELVARAIHYNGIRKEKPFLALFCGSLPDTLLQSELFGHKKGSFTGATADKPGLFEVADGGTLFLDEVGDLSPTLQTALLRVLQEGEVKRVGESKPRKVDVRVISATNKSIENLIQEGNFREDLYYRLNTIRLETPPLRNRIEDIPLLANHFLDKYATGKRSAIEGFTRDALKRMQKHHWPGNVRELQNTIERAVIMSNESMVGVKDLNLPEESQPPADFTNLLQQGLNLKEIEQEVVKKALASNDGNVSETARQLGVSRTWIHYRIKEWESQTK